MEKSWKKIVTAMKKWDKLRKGIVAEIHKEDNQSMNVEYMDLSESVTPGEAINVFTMSKPLTSDDFLMCEDGADMNGKALQDFLTSLFNEDSLRPVVEPVESDDEVETIVTPIGVNEQIGFDKMETVKTDAVERSSSIVKEDPKPVVEITPENNEKPVISNSIFKKKSDNTTSSQQSLNFNNPGMYGNMFGQMGMMNPMMARMPTMNMDDMCLGDVINPYANY